MLLYFAYGSNMDRAGMASRCPASRPVGPARLPGHRFIIGAQGWASVIRDCRAEVWGVLWQLAHADVPALDRYENVAAGLYRKSRCAVWTQTGRHGALVYRMPASTPGRPRPGYLEQVVAAAQLSGLPTRYVAGLGRVGVARVRPARGGPPSAIRCLRRSDEPVRPACGRTRPTEDCPFVIHV